MLNMYNVALHSLVFKKYLTALVFTDAYFIITVYRFGSVLVQYYRNGTGTLI